MAAKKPYQNIMVDERGMPRVPTGGFGDRQVGMDIEEDYAADTSRDWWTRRAGGDRSVGFLPPSIMPAGTLAGPGFRGYSGIMRGLARGAQAQGRGFDVDVEDWGNSKQMDVPSGRTYSVDAGELAPGMRGRPNAAIAALTGADTNKRGYYTPEEFEGARQGLQRAFRGRR